VSELFTEGSFPVGLIPEANHTSMRAKLEPGDTLVLFSDGVTEAADLDQQLFGDSRLQSVLKGQHDAPLDDLRQKIVDAVEQFSGKASQADDITLLLVRFRAAATSASATAD
jgi:sigma-B regulation protein RsbU (phosphoserine phosphatase)